MHGDLLLLNHYVETLLGSRAKLKILRALHRHRGKEFTVRELSRYIGLSHTGVLKAVDDLYDMNAVTLRGVGRSNTITLNVGSHAAKLVEHVFSLEETTMEELLLDIRSSLCDEHGIEGVAIFGSVARGEEKPRSDIDLLIIADQSEGLNSSISDLQLKVSRKYGNQLSPYFIWRGEPIDAEKSKLLEEIINNHILVCGDIPNLELFHENEARRKASVPELPNEGERNP
jgi:predicted nucleotidyltransferase